MTYYGHRRDDLSALTDDTIKELKKNIRDGAKDVEQRWANALELVHKAYEVAEVQRPDITMRDAWKQYESLIRFAVNELANTRGMDGEWRMTNQITVEGVDCNFCFVVRGKTFDGENYQHEVFTDDIANVVGPIVEQTPHGCTVDTYVDDNDAVIHFKENGVRTGDKIYVHKQPISEAWNEMKYKKRLETHAKRARGDQDQLKQTAEYMYDKSGWKHISGKKNKEEFVKDYIEAARKYGRVDD